MGSKKTGAGGRVLEAGVKDDIKAILGSLDRCFYFMPPSNVFGIIGISDFLGLVEGLFFAVEVKRDARAHMTIPQRLFLANVRRAGGLALRVDSTNVHLLRDRILRHIEDKRP